MELRFIRIIVQVLIFYQIDVSCWRLHGPTQEPHHTWSYPRAPPPPPPWSHSTPSVVFRRPMDAMVDLTNDLGVAILQDYSYSRSNFAFSPYGVASVLVVLYEGARGESARQIHSAAKFPWDRDITRIGFRDIHRHLRSYFSHEGYLSGITLNKDDTTLLPEYKQVLRFYGYDVDAEPDRKSTTPASGTQKPTTRKPNKQPTTTHRTTTIRQQQTTTRQPTTTKQTTVTETSTKFVEISLIQPASTTTTETVLGTTEHLMTTSSSQDIDQSSAESRSTTENVETSTVAQTTQSAAIFSTTPAEQTTTKVSEPTEAPSTTESVSTAEEIVSERTTEESIDTTTQVVTETISTQRVDLTTPEDETTTVERTVDNGMLIPQQEETTESTTASDTEEISKLESRIGVDYLIDRYTALGFKKVNEKLVEEEKKRTQQKTQTSTKTTATEAVTEQMTSTTEPEEELETTTSQKYEEYNLPITEPLVLQQEPEFIPKTLEEFLSSNKVHKPIPEIKPFEEDYPSIKNLISQDFIAKTIDEYLLLKKTVLASVVEAQNTPQIADEVRLETGKDEELKMVDFVPKTLEEYLSYKTKIPENIVSKFVPKTLEEYLSKRLRRMMEELRSTQGREKNSVDFRTIASFNRQTIRTRRTINDFQRIPLVPELSLQLQNGMFDSHVSKSSALYERLPRRSFLVDGSVDTPVPVMTYTSVFPFAYIERLHSLALEFPLDDERYKLLIILPIERRGLRQLIYDMNSCPLREVYEALTPTTVKAVVPTFMIEGFVILTPTLQKMGIWDVFDPRRSNLSGMSNDPELYVRNIEQSVTVVIRNYVEILDIQTRTMAAREMEEEFIATHPFLYFVMDSDTNVSLMAGQIVDPLNSRIY